MDYMSSNIKWEALLPPLLEEYKMLWGEMNNRWTQQQNLIATAWLVLGGGIAFVASKVQPESGAIAGEIPIQIALLMPLALSFLCGIFIRHDDKVWRIVGYLYLSLRPQVQKVVDNMSGQQELAADRKILIWQWPNYELPRAFDPRWRMYLFHPVIDGTRYLIMIDPAFLLLFWLWLRLGNAIWCHTLFWLDLFALVISIGWTMIVLWQYFTLLNEIKKQYDMSRQKHV